MHRATPSTSSSSSSSSRRSRKRPLSREQLLKSLEILGPYSTPLPDVLPPSPPASRESSPAPGHKRRHDHDVEQSRSKRPRTSSTSSYSRPQPPSRPAPVASSSRHEPSEDGEVKEEPPVTRALSPVALPSNLPARRPRRGKLPPSEWEGVFEKCFANARMLKYSAYARVAAAHSTTSKEYKPLRVAPDPNTTYAQDSLLMARLELVDSLLHFIYGLWCRDYSAGTCYRASWRTVDDAINRTESKWQSESTTDREKAFLGLIQMVHAFILGRKLHYHVDEVDLENHRKLNRLRIQWQAEQDKRAEEQSKRAAGSGGQSNATPNMLPSPASSSTPSSSNSTPLGGHGTPSHNGTTPVVNPPVRTPAPSKDAFTLPPPHVKTLVNAQFVWENKSQSVGLRAASVRVSHAQTYLNLPVLFKHFPGTFARMINSSLSAGDEHEPDFQDDECELYWPGQLITGSGLGWVCLMGMSMVKEFGREYGYLGVNGVVPKLDGDENLGYAEPRFFPHTR